MAISIAKVAKRQLLHTKIPPLLTGVHPVRDISYQKPCFLEQILRLCRFDKVPTLNMRPAGTNLQIQPIVLQENNQTSIFFLHASANQQCNNYIRLLKDHVNSSFKRNVLPPLWYVAILVEWYQEANVNLLS
jgi:hypothetical protein